MSLIDTILNFNGGKIYDIWTATEKKNAQAGSKIKTYEYLTNVYAVIQPNERGLSLLPTVNAGDKTTSDLVMFSKHERFEKERVLYRNVFYEIRSIEYYNNGILQFYKSYLVKVDNQDVKFDKR